MSIWSSLFGKQEIKPAVGGQMISTTELPAELKPYYKDILTKAQALYNDKTDQGYQLYEGATLADFTPEQKQVQSGISGLVGSQAPVYQEAMGMTRDAATPFTTEQVEEYMSPYQQAVTDIEKREATKQYQSNVVPQLAAQAAMTQPFGGSRQAILEGMAADTQQRLLGDIQAKGSAQGYTDAINRLESDRLAKGQGASQLANLGSGQYRAASTELSNLQLVGDEKQKRDQTVLDEAFKQKLEELQFPYDTMGKYQSMVIGAPMGQTTYSKPQAAVMGPSFGQQLIGGLGGLGNIYGSFTGKTIGGQPYTQAGLPVTSKHGGSVGAKIGGGLSTLIKRANGKNIGSPINVDTKIGLDMSQFNPKEGGPANNNEDETFKTNFGINSMDAYQNYILNFAGPYSERFKQSEADLQESNKLMEKDLARDKSYLQADRDNAQFNREQAAFTAMARLGTDQDVTDAPGGGVGQILTMLGKAGPEIGAAEAASRANIRQQDREVGKLEIQYKKAMASGNLELANTYMAQLQALSGEYAKYMTAKAAGLEASGIGDLTPESINDIIGKVGAQTNPNFKLLLTKGATIKGLNDAIPNPLREGATGTWTQNEILVWAQNNARQQMEIAVGKGAVYPNAQLDFEQLITTNIIKLFQNANPTAADVSEGAKKTINDGIVDGVKVPNSTIGNAKNIILGTQ